MNNYLKEWNDACAYAYECFPPFIYDLNKEPYTALFTIGMVCFICYKLSGSK